MLRLNHTDIWLLKKIRRNGKKNMTCTFRLLHPLYTILCRERLLWL